MSETLELKTARKCSGNAFYRLLIPSWFSMALWLGLTPSVNQSTSFAQFQGGDLPASPWSKNADTRQVNAKSVGDSSSKERLRQPRTLVQPVRSGQPAGPEERHSVERPPKELSRPAPVTLMGPMMSSTALPWLALTQKMPIETKSDWHRVQAGGLILNEEIQLPAERLEIGSGSSREQMDARGNRMIGPGLPDRESTAAVHLLAQRVSHERLSDPVTSQSLAPEILESLPGWQSVERELKQRLERCDSLLKRGAVLSAREEASQGLLRLYRTMDLHRGSMFSESFFEKALTAIREEADFQKYLGGSGVQSIVDNHTTDVLKNRTLELTSPEMAAMHYRLFARYQLVAASDGHPWAADLLYAYGRTLEKDAELNPDRAVMFRNQAVVLYQAATQTKPTQSEAANQLGFVLIHLDRIDDAYTALAASIQIKPNANAWNNLAEVFRQRGSVADAEYASQQATALIAGNPQFSPENPEITEVDPALFAKYSPMPLMGSSLQNFSYNNVPTSVSNGSGSNVRNASSGKSLFSKILR